MNDVQKEWTCKQCDALLIAAGDYRLSEHDWEVLIAMSNDIATKAKNNPEVKKAICVTINYIEKMYNIMREK